MTAEHPVARYYDRNTRRFLNFGGGAKRGAIHRQLWGHGVESSDEASGFINELIADALREDSAMPSATVIDLGCGVGGSVLHLARSFPQAALHGVTISERQAELAREACARDGVDDRCRFYAADFESVRLGFEADAIFAIESFVHTVSADNFFATVAAHLAPRGRAIVIDDFVAQAPSDASAHAQLIAARFRLGWRAPSFGTVRQCAEAAARHGLDLVEDCDFSCLIRTDRPRDRVVSVLGPIAARLRLTGLPFFGNLIGGHALAEGLRSNTISYRWLEFRNQSGRPRSLEEARHSKQQQRRELCRSRDAMR